MWEIVFSKNRGESEAGRLVPDLFVFEKALHDANARSTLVSIYFSGPRLGDIIKTNYMKL